MCFLHDLGYSVRYCDLDGIWSYTDISYCSNGEYDLLEQQVHYHRRHLHHCRRHYYRHRNRHNHHRRGRHDYHHHHRRRSRHHHQ